jgi:hypothetical protein
VIVAQRHEEITSAEEAIERAHAPTVPRAATPQGVHLCSDAALPRALSRDIGLRRAGDAAYTMLADCQISPLPSVGNRRIIARSAWA